MVVLLLFYLVGVFVVRTNSGVVPQDFKSIPNESSHLEAIFTNNATNENNLTFNNSDVHNDLSSLLVHVETLNASHVSTIDLHNISDSDHAKEGISEHHPDAVKKISTGSGHPKKKVSKESKKKRGSSSKTVLEESDHADANDLKSSIEDHSHDFHHRDNNVSKRFDHIATITDNNNNDLKSSASIGDHSDDFHQGDNNVSKRFDHTATITDNNKDNNNDLKSSTGDHSHDFHHGDNNVSKRFDHTATITDNNQDNNNDLKSSVSIEDHSDDFHHGDNNVSKRFDHTVNNTDNNNDLKSSASIGGHSEDFHDGDNNFSKGFDHTATITDNNNHDSNNGLKQSASIEDHSEDFHHGDNNVSNGFDHTVNITDNNNRSNHSEHITNVHLDNRSDHSEHINNFDNTSDHPEHIKNVHFDNSSDHSEHINNFGNTSDHSEHIINVHFDNRSDHHDNLITESNDVDNVSISSDHHENIINKEFNTSLSEDKNHFEDVESDNHFNPDHLNDLVVDLNVPLKEATENISKELNQTLNTTSEHNNHTATADTQENFEKQTGHVDHKENARNTSIHLNLAAANLSNSSKLFLNIHNSFMKLNPTDKASSGNSIHIHDRPDTDKIDEDILEKSLETDISSKGSSEVQTDKPSNIWKKLDSIKIPDSDTKENEFEPNSNADSPSTVAPNDIAVNLSSDHPEEEFNGDLNKSELINSDIKETIVTETNETHGLFSTLGLDFLMNSELAKNAASAMEVFNFSDSALTDHIVDDKNDMHDFLDNHNHNDNNHFEPDLTPSTSSTAEAESSTIIDSESSTIIESESSTIIDAESSTTESSKLELESSSSSENGIFEVFTTTPSHLNSTVEDEITTMPSQLLLNSSVEYVVTTLPSKLLLNSSVEYVDTTTISPPPMPRNGSEITSEVKCPPPGFCIFWFLGQDTCTVNSHCLGSRICCRIGCTKTCIEV